MSFMKYAALFLLAMPAFAAPSLLLSPADVARIKKLVETEPWAGKIVATLTREATEWPTQHVREYGLTEWALPKEGSGWSHNYVCPDHGVRLTQKSGKNLCPIDGKDYHGWPVDYVVFMQRNNDNARAARDLGLAFHLTGNAAFAEKARRICNAYSDLYLTLPIHDNANKPDTKTGARVMSQTLSEASWLVPLAFGYDLVRDTMTAAERARFETNVLKGAATANIIAKIAHGICDDLVSLMACAAACPIMLAPAMNDRMWANPIAQENVAKLKLHGHRFIGPEAGWLACRNVGAGRLSEPSTIVEQVVGALADSSLPSRAIDDKSI